MTPRLSIEVLAFIVGFLALATYVNAHAIKAVLDANGNIAAEVGR